MFIITFQIFVIAFDIFVITFHIFVIAFHIFENIIYEKVSYMKISVRRFHSSSCSCFHHLQIGQLLFGLPKYLIQRLQAIQNCAARLVSCKPKYAPATPILRELHWLPVKSRIIFKILLLVDKSLNNLAPAYINSLLKNYKPSRNLRSVDQGLLTVPKSNQRTYGDRAFSVAAPKLWNSLPLDIRNSGSITLFKCKLKTFLFKKYYL